jgi:hypothetical protein
MMNDAQLQQLIGVIRAGGGGGHKTTKFSSAEGTEWRIWRRNFEQTLLINGWNNERCQRECAAGMESTAAEFTSDIPGFVAGRDIQVLLNLYEARFLPAAAGQLAAAQFQTAAQMDGEQIAVWHSRLRTIFERAFPGENIQESRLLINKFVLKLSDSNIRQWTHRANPATYNDAMTAASNEAASQSILAHEAGGGGKSNITINAFGGGVNAFGGNGGQTRGACHGCGSFTHHIAECKKQRQDRYRDQRPRGRGQPRGDRGGRGRGGGFNRTYLRSRGSRGSTSTRGFGYSNRNGGSLNGIGEEQEQRDQYSNEHDGHDDTPSLNNVNGELDQENY